MNIPTVCYTCGKHISDKYEKFIKLMRLKYTGNEDLPHQAEYNISGSDKYKSNEDICNELGVKWPCCRMHLIGAVDSSQLMS